jgi:four helix bundle protein
MQNYKELEVWQKAVALTTELYKITGTFPYWEKFGLTAQIRRAATSVPANIAEGWGRGSTKEYIQFLLVARGSLMELETHLIVSRNIGLLAEQALREAESRVESIAKMLNRLVSSLRARRSGRAVPNP